MRTYLASRLNEPSTWAGVGGIGTLLVVLQFIAAHGSDGMALVVKLIPYISSGDYIGAALAVTGFLLAIIKREKGTTVNAVPVGRADNGATLYALPQDVGFQ
jgi:hypothetical protein